MSRLSGGKKTVLSDHSPGAFHAKGRSKRLHRSQGVVLSHPKTLQKLKNEFREG